ncbi:MAG: lipoyl(octanoyl) transferase LipB [Candidatus Latescibacteria bacterium]|nr:lipoyl(octanoyl) transferase LipB [Candidatus Latescibacterota bacterium]NIO01033.1 lipoyl(octanoyl) transferase LipB [Candidatus Latescibacterota bacterium]NIO27432.1 lipoyl(octanoyl) transferase LipB [Candidatus Latescibacterota bacterium]NIO54954.1 lipoyl(octanoyl) transferase LipB [Candidatus Latescibacterota bacterium]NIT01043.1 lipoyl(octanoyl) transferase LipB [Candidatus Latescibacterota bacterium]
MIRCSAYDLGCVPYREAFILQRRMVEKLQSGSGEEALILLEHPHVITLGRSASADSLLSDPASLKERGVDVIETDRGGDATYHGPGQLVGYPIFKLEPERRDIRKYVSDIELALIRALADFGIEAGRQTGKRGVWIQRKKIASVGIRISRWVTCHGFALNVNTDLSYFEFINPCGITGCEMTSMQRELGVPISMASVKRQAVERLSEIFDREIVHGVHSNEITAFAE